MARQGARPPPNGSLPQWDGWVDDDTDAAAAEIAALLRAARVNATVDPNDGDRIAAQGTCFPCSDAWLILLTLSLSASLALSFPSHDTGPLKVKRMPNLGD